MGGWLGQPNFQEGQLNPRVSLSNFLARPPTWALPRRHRMADQVCDHQPWVFDSVTIAGGFRLKDLEVAVLISGHCC